MFTRTVGTGTLLRVGNIRLTRYPADITSVTDAIDFRKHPPALHLLLGEFQHALWNLVNPVDCVRSGCTRRWGRINRRRFRQHTHSGHPAVLTVTRPLVLRVGVRQVTEQSRRTLVDRRTALPADRGRRFRHRTHRGSSAVLTAARPLVLRVGVRQITEQSRRTLVDRRTALSVDRSRRPNRRGGRSGTAFAPTTARRQDKQTCD